MAGARSATRLGQPPPDFRDDQAPWQVPARRRPCGGGSELPSGADNHEITEVTTGMSPATTPGDTPLSLRLHHRCATSTTRRLLLAGSARTKTRKRQPGPTPIPMEPYLVCARPHDLPEHAVAADVRQLVGVRGEVRLRAGVRVVPGFMTLICRAAPPRVATEKPSPSVWICATYCTVRGDAEGAKADACPRCSATICIGVRTAGTNRNASGWCRPPTREPGPRRAR